MSLLASYSVAVLVTLLVNLPFGWWRAGLRKFSLAWYVAVHAAVPAVIGLRLALGLQFRWETLPVFLLAYFGGQYLGSRWRRRADAAGG
jgi:hypothetical protein